MSVSWAIPLLIAASVLVDEGEELARAGRFSEAYEKTSAGCDALRVELGAANPTTIACGTRLANRTRDAGRYAQSLELARGAGDGLERAVGDRHPDTLAARQAQSQALWFLARYGEALDLAQRVWTVRKEVLGAEHVDTLATRNTIGASLRGLGRNGEAIAVYREILAIHERDRGRADHETLRVKNNIAIALQRTDRVDEALALFEDIVETRRATQGPRHPDTLLAESNVISTLLQAGDAVEALRRCDQALPLFTTAFGPSHPSTLRLQSRRSQILSRLGREDDAVALAKSLVPKFEAALGARHPETLQLKANIGIAELRAGRSREALARLGAAYEEMTAAFGRDHASPAAVREAMGFAQLHQGRFEEAREIFEGDLRAERLPPVEAGVVSFSLLVRHAGSAQARFELGDRQVAIARLQDVLARKRAQYGPDHEQVLDTLVTLASLQERAGDADGAIASLEELVKRTETVVQGRANSEAHLAMLAQRVGEDFHRAGYFSLARLLATRDARRALEIAELSKSRSLTDALGTDLRAAKLDPEARRRLGALSMQLASVQSNLLQDAPGSEAHATRLAERTRLQTRIAEIVPPQRERSSDAIPRLPPDAAYVSYLVAGDRVVALVARAGRDVKAFDLGSWPALAETVEAYRRLLAAPSPDTERVWRTGNRRFAFGIARPHPDAVRVRGPDEIAAELGRFLLAPLDVATKGARHWIVAPDGALAFLPFDPLPMRGRPLIEAASVSYAPSLATMSLLLERSRIARPGRDAREFLGIAVSSEATLPAAGLVLPALPSAEAEVKRIAALFGASRSATLLGKQATRPALDGLSERGELAAYRFIHLATHAFLSEREARLSAVVLEGDILNAVELSALQLGADLVVLSACETGLGRAAAAEGVVGLPQAIIAAGAGSALLSLWRVTDRGTEAFMVSFYRRLLAGAAPAAALRETKLEFARSKGPWSAPRHWAPYVLYGAS